MKIAKNENRISIIIIASILILVGLLSVAYNTPGLNPKLEKDNYTILQKSELPNELNEISGIDWLGDNKIACVQDEDGIIFIYNLTTSAVEKEINFSKAGDYEGIALVDNTAYILRADGEIFEVVNFLSDNFEVKTYKTSFSEKNNMESLTYDMENNRLLLCPKDNDLESEDNMGVYAFNLNTKRLDNTPILQINHNDPIFESKKKDKKKKKSSNSIHPADIAINPQNGNIYIVDGKNPQLLIMDTSGKTSKIYTLQEKTFNQPEGIIFSPDGSLYISNEGKKGTANILKVELH